MYYKWDIPDNFKIIYECPVKCYKEPYYELSLKLCDYSPVMAKDGSPICYICIDPEKVKSDEDIMSDFKIDWELLKLLQEKDREINVKKEICMRSMWRRN